MGKSKPAGKGKMDMKKFEGTALDKKVDMAAIKKVNAGKAKAGPKAGPKKGK